MKDLFSKIINKAYILFLYNIIAINKREILNRNVIYESALHDAVLII